MDKLLLTYNEPMLLTYSEKLKESKPKRVLSILGRISYRVAVGVCAVISSLCLIDIIDSPLTDSMMTGVYAIADFFAPDLELFDDTTRLGFVSKFMNSDFRYVGECEGVQHIIPHCDIKCENGVIVYTTNGAGRIFAPANCLVKSIDDVGGATFLSLSIGSDMIIVIESNLAMGVTVGQYISRGSLIGSYAGVHQIKMSIYRNGQLVDEPIADKDIKWLPNAN